LILGIGRVGVDRLVEVDATGERFDSAKLNCVRRGRRVGGSVPLILQAVVKQSGETCQMIVPDAGGVEGDWIREELSSAGLHPIPYSVRDRAESTIVHDAEGKLRVILVTEEDEDSELPTTVGHAISLEAVDALVADGHQVAATHSLVGRCRDLSVPIVFDPGSTYRSTRRAASIREIARLATIVVASEEFSAELFDLGEVEKSGLLGQPRMRACAWIVTHEDGSLSVISHERLSRLPAVPVEPRGSSLGTGDLFRGAFLAALIKIGALARADAGIGHETLESAALAGRKAAIWRIEERGEIPTCPSTGDLEGITDQRDRLG
jgi:sugar/nucleoside kinase (ribokinase family)